MHHKKWQRVLAGLLAGLLCCSMLPMAAFADSTPDLAASGNVIAEASSEESSETEEALLPDKTAPPTENSAEESESVTSESAPEEATLSAEAQAFVNAVNAFDRDTAIAKANAWGLAKLAANADPENTELAATFEKAIAEADEAAAPVYAADELYTQIPEDERGGEAVTAAYAALAALFFALQYAMENPVLPDAEPSTPTTENAVAILYDDLPDALTGSYIGSMGLPVATGDTKISISAWNTDLMDDTGAGRLDAAPLNEDGLTMTVGRLAGKEYAIVPILVQTEYPANGSAATVSLPENVTVLSYTSTADHLIAASDTEKAEILNSSLEEIAASAKGFYVKATGDFTATFSYTADNTTITKTLHIKVAEKADNLRAIRADGAATYAVDGPAPPFTSGVITKTQRGSSTWVLWFNGVEAYCCSHGLAGRVNGCPTYGYAYTSLLGPDQLQDTHEATQINIWGALGQLNLGLLAQQHTDAIADSQFAHAAATYAIADTELLNYCYQYYDDMQMAIILNYPDSKAAQLYLNSAKAAMGMESGVSTFASSTGYYTWIYQPPISGWQTLALIGPPVGEDGGGDFPPAPQEFYADWSVGPQSASGSFDSGFAINTDKIQLETLEKVDGAGIEVEPLKKGGTIDGGNWAIAPADKQTITTSGHTLDDNFQNNGGDGSANWSLHYSVSKTTSGGKSGSVGPYSSQAEADSAASSAESGARSELQAEAQRMVDNAIATAKAELTTLDFRFDEVILPYGFDLYDGDKGGKQTITVPADSSKDYLMRNDEWSLAVNIRKTDSETGKQIAADAVYEIYEWDTVTQKYIPTGGYNRYAVERQTDGTYAVINHSSYADTTAKQHNLYYTQRNEGKFIFVEVKAPTGYYGDWTDIAKPGTADTPLGKRAYYIEVTKANDGSTIWLDNSDYSADISTGYTGGTKLLTSGGVETTVTVSATGAQPSIVNYKDATKTYTTDSTGLAANEDTYTSVPKDTVFQNDRVLGELTLTKVDLDAMKYLAAGSNGNSTLEGAVYDLYAADNILHPDGVTGVVDYSKITKADGTPIWHTTVFDGNSWNDEYLPVLAKDHLVASAPIKDGKLVFANLYLGRYYLVERATGIVLPLDGAGNYVVNGVYPELNAKLERTGKNLPLAKNGADEYTDYVYRNQYSEVAVSRNLAGVKTYDGYYKSYATGYLCDEVNHYKTLTYGGEAVYVNRDSQQSQDEVMKSGFSIQKLVSTTGQPSPALELAGAGFTVYRISDLSREASFIKNADGSYDIQSILTAYRKDKYDQDIKKYDFSKEQQAVATMYESDSAVVDAYNATLTGVGENTNGSGYGWRPTGTAAQYRLSEIFTNEIGVLRVEGLAYGQYLIVETTVPKDVFQADPFIVKVNGSTPQSEFCVPAGSVTTPSNSYQAYHILDEELEGYLQLVKIDAETGKPVKLANTAFKLYRIGEDGKETIVQMNDPASGNAFKKTTIFYTDADGYLKTPEKLPLGKYRVVEVQGPNGYFNDEQYDVVFELTSDTVYQVDGNSYDDMDDYVITKEYINRETLGKITIRKTGEVLTGFEETFDPNVIDLAYTSEAVPGDFTYEERPLAGAEYTITAAEDIFTQDRQTDASGNRTLWYAKGDVVAVVTTGDGAADIDAFAPTRTTATYDFLSVIHDGTIGEVSVTLSLGSYHIEESKPPHGYVGTFQSYDVTLAWDNQTNEVMLAKTIVSHTEDGSSNTADFEIVEENTATAAEKEAQVLSYHNEREKARVGVYKVDSLTGEYVAGAVFNLYATDDIYNADGNLVFAAGDLIATSPETKADGLTYFNVDVPIRGEYYDVDHVQIPTASGKSSATNSGNYTIVEIRPPQGYFLNDTLMQVAFTYDGQVLEILDGTCKNTHTSVLISKRELTGDDELPGATLTVQDNDGNIVREWVSTDTPTEICGLHLNEIYTLVETRPADGYALASSIQFKLVQSVDENGNLMNATDVYVLTGKDWLIFDHWTLMEDGMVMMRDDTTKVQISKQDITTHKELPGAHLTITDETGKVVADWVSTDKPYYIEKLPAGKYTLTEVQAPNGYDKAESIAFEVLHTGDLQTVTMYDRRTPDKPQDTPTPTPDTPPTPTHTPTPVRTIPQTGDNSNLLLWAALCGASICALIVIAVRRKHSNLPAKRNETIELVDEDAGKQNNDEE